VLRVSSKQSNFRFGPKQIKTQSVSVVFWFVSQNEKTFFSVCFGVSDRYRNNRNKQNFLETKRKNLQKNLGVLETVNCFSRFEPKQTKTQSVSVVFRFAFSRNQTNFFSVCFDVSDRYRNYRNKQNLWYGELKRLMF
jgi:hypothetical protein